MYFEIGEMNSSFEKFTKSFEIILRIKKNKIFLEGKLNDNFSKYYLYHGNYI
jgi:hypothetical protein